MMTAPFDFSKAKLPTPEAHFCFPPKSKIPVPASPFLSPSPQGFLSDLVDNELFFDEHGVPLDKPSPYSYGTPGILYDPSAVPTRSKSRSPTPSLSGVRRARKWKRPKPGEGQPVPSSSDVIEQKCLEGLDGDNKAGLSDSELETLAKNKAADEDAGSPQSKSKSSDDVSAAGAPPKAALWGSAKRLTGSLPSVIAPKAKTPGIAAAMTTSVKAASAFKTKASAKPRVPSTALDMVQHQALKMMKRQGIAPSSDEQRLLRSREASREKGKPSMKSALVCTKAFSRRPSPGSGPVSAAAAASRESSTERRRTVIGAVGKATAFVSAASAGKAKNAEQEEAAAATKTRKGTKIGLRGAATVASAMKTGAAGTAPAVQSTPLTADAKKDEKEAEKAKKVGKKGKDSSKDAKGAKAEKGMTDMKATKDSKAAVATGEDSKAKPEIKNKQGGLVEEKRNERRRKLISSDEKLKSENETLKMEIKQLVQEIESLKGQLAHERTLKTDLERQLTAKTKEFESLKKRHENEMLKFRDHVEKTKAGFQECQEASEAHIRPKFGLLPIEEEKQQAAQLNTPGEGQN